MKTRGMMEVGLPPLDYAIKNALNCRWSHERLITFEYNEFSD